MTGRQNQPQCRATHLRLKLPVRFAFWLFVKMCFTAWSAFASCLWCCFRLRGQHQYTRSPGRPKFSPQSALNLPSAAPSARNKETSETSSLLFSAAAPDKQSDPSKCSSCFSGQRTLASCYSVDCWNCFAACSKFECATTAWWANFFFQFILGGVRLNFSWDDCWSDFWFRPNLSHFLF